MMSISRQEIVDVPGREDVWTGITDPKERRRRQNRLNQRARRRRQDVGPEEIKPVSSQVLVAHDHGSGTSEIYQRQTTLFPLNRDHELLQVVAMNVARAILTNYGIVSSSANFFSTSLSCAGISIAAQAGVMDQSALLPLSLQPTSLQVSITHPFWIDLFPFPKLRERLIIAIRHSEFDGDSFINDMIGDIFRPLGCVFEPKKPTVSQIAAIDPMLLQSAPTFSTSQACSDGQPGIIAWSDPWKKDGWEVTEGFAKKWSFLLKDCPEVLVATNKWRLTRGEELLHV